MTYATNSNPYFTETCDLYTVAYDSTINLASSDATITLTAKYLKEEKSPYTKIISGTATSISSPSTLLILANIDTTFMVQWSCPTYYSGTITINPSTLTA